MVPRCPDDHLPFWSMERVFLSSLARGEMGDIRRSAKAAVESLAMQPVMFETEGANEHDSRRALLALIPGCDAYLLLLGAQYGEPGDSGLSPTEEEFEEALSSGRPILALVQIGVDPEQRQQQFIARVRGTWEDGHFAPTFTDSSDVVTAVVRALNGWRNRVPAAAARGEAARRVSELGSQRGRWSGSPGGATLRTVTVPLVRRPLLDAVRLTDGTAVDAVIAAARASGIISQSQGVEPSVDAESIHLVWQPDRGFDRYELVVAADGSVVAEGPAGADRRDPASLGWMVVLHDRIPEVISQGLRFVDEVWRAIDTRRDITQAFLGASVTRAKGKSYSFVEPIGRVSMGSSMGLPDVIVVPAEPLLVRREDLMAPENATRLQAEIRHRFEVAGAVNTR